MTTALRRLLIHLTAFERHPEKKVPTGSPQIVESLTLKGMPKGTGGEGRLDAAVLEQESWMMIFDVCSNGIRVNLAGSTGRTFKLGSDAREGSPSTRA